ncbi:MAG: tRNA (adenosine(37)-N6)-dimethylallyltransferase MiaA [Clostridiales bacterium]|nr:tRNA (adenosine(37)-N6)-dimethylallyltransferase MiaA [Clostridiales bacterium]
MKQKIIVVAGPTASGKTALGIEIAKSLGGEIISADSMQVYKGMPIATACPTEEEKEAVFHHLVEFLDRSENFSVALWCDLAREKISDISLRGKVPVIVGGTGLFIDSLVDNTKFENVKVDEKLRKKLMERDSEELYDELVTVDADAAKDIHKNNKKRVVRALELYYGGVSKTTQNLNSHKEESPYETLYFVLNYQDRSLLYNRIDMRVDMMIKQGLENEARSALNNSSKTSAQAIGHKELYPYFNGEITFDEAIENLKKETRHYAKRQITWFKRRKDAVILHPDVLGNDKLVKTAIEKCEEFLNG